MGNVPFPAGSEADLAAQLRVLRAIHGVGAVPAPAALRARIELARAPARPPRHTRRGRLSLALASPVAACAALTVALVLGGQSPAVATVADAAVLASRPVQAPVSEPRGDEQTLPRVTAAGLTYPYWEDRFGYRATGVRRDRIGGREATTVTYVHGARRLAYTIVAGSPLAPGGRMRTSFEGGVVVRSLSMHGTEIVTWLRDGHTCVLVGAGSQIGLLTRLAVSSTYGAPHRER
jgi:hypothetical protein